MKSLEWCELAEKLYAFKSEADKYGFYVPETQKMVESLELMCPFNKNEQLDEKVKELAKDKKKVPFVESDEELHAPAFDDEDDDDIPFAVREAL